MQSNWYKNCYRRSLVDMHIHHWSDEFLSEFSAEDYLAYLKAAKMQSAMIYLQSHVGLCYYPTKSGIMHKSFIGREDEMRRLVDMCHENGIKVVGYYSLIYNTLEEERHPEWRIIDDEEGGTSPRQRHVIRYGLCCPNNPDYRDFLKAQIKEMADYFDLDGIFFDMTFWLVVCRCKHCKARWEKETGLKEMPKSIGDFKSKESLLLQQKRYDWMADFAKFVHDYAKEVMPGVTVSQNNASSVGADYQRGVDERVGEEGCDYMTGDVGGSVLMHSFGAKYFRSASHVQPFEYMVIRFPQSLAQHTTSKSVREFAQLSLLTAAHHGASFMIDSIDPSGTLNPAVAKEIGEAFEMQIPYEPYLDRGKPVSDVAIWYSLRGIYNSEGRDFNTKTASKNLGETLGANHVLYDVIPSVRLNRLNEFKVVFAPAIAGIEKKHIDAVEEYVREGGIFCFSGVESIELLQRFFGKDVKVEGFAERMFNYIAPTESGKDMLAPFDEKYPVSLMHQQPKLTGVKEDAVIHGKLVLPYIDYEDPHHFSAIHSDPPGIKTDYPSIMETTVGKGKVIWWGVPIENYTDRQSRELIMQILSHYLPESERILTAERAPMCELVVFRDENEWLISAVNVGDAEDGRLVPDFKVKIQSDASAKGVYLLPERTPVPFSYEDGRIVFTVKDLDLFDMYSVEL